MSRILFFSVLFSSVAVAGEPTCTDLAGSYRNILEAHPGSMTPEDIDKVLTNVAASCESDNRLDKHHAVATCIIDAKSEDAWLRCLELENGSDFYSWFGKLVRR